MGLLREGVYGFKISGVPISRDGHLEKFTHGTDDVGGHMAARFRLSVAPKD